MISLIRTLPAILVAVFAATSPPDAVSITSAGAAPQAPADNPPRPRFEQATVTPHAPAAQPGIPPLVNGRFMAGGMTLKELIRIAYGSSSALMANQVVGGPPWSDSDRFDIDAQVGSALSNVGSSAHPQVTRMLRTLLTDRFKLELATESRQLPVADLVLADTSRKPGAALRPSTANCVDLLTNPSPPPDHFLERVCGMSATAPGLMAGKKVTMAAFAGLLSQRPEVNRVVRDRTGLEGAFDFRVEYTPDPVPASVTSPSSNAPAAPISAALLTALEAQLGLRLEAHEGPVDVFVIHHAEKPAAK